MTAQEVCNLIFNNPVWFKMGYTQGLDLEVVKPQNSSAVKAYDLGRALRQGLVGKGNLIPCAMCDGHIFIIDTDHPDVPNGILYSHYEDTGCDDPVPARVS